MAMATMKSNSSDESCTAPDNFHISLGNDDDNTSRLTLTQMKCPLCFTPKKIFHCRDCIRHGNIVHSTTKQIADERFYDKQIKFMNIKTTNNNINEKVNYYLQKKKVIENLKTNIIEKKEKINLIKNLLNENQNNLHKDVEKRKHLTNFNRTLRIKLPKYEDKVKELENYVITKSDDISKRQEIYNKLELELKVIIRECIKKLIKYIFPIKKIIGKGEIQNPNEISDLERDLADATRNINSRERCSFTQDSQNDCCYIIVAPYLPANGDYSDYNEWVASIKDGVPSSSSSTVGTVGTGVMSGRNDGTNIDIMSRPNPATRISAALTYTAQLVQVLSFYLDIRLPFKTVYSEFCSCMLSEQQITRRVARLNANILYLCYTQSVKISQLYPSHTLENVLKLLDIDKNDLGHVGPVDPNNSCLTKKLEKQLIEELEYGDETDSDDENNFPNEWENVSHNILLSSSSQSILLLNNEAVVNFNQQNLLNQQQQQQQHQQATASMAGGLMTSAAASLASIWRGWTTGR